MTDVNGVGTAIGLGALAYKAADKLISPAADRIGLSLYRVVDSFASWQEENLKRIFGKWAGRREGKQLSDEELGRVMPLLPFAAKVSEDDLQERWASLLENTATSAERPNVSFAQTLSQLTPDEARTVEEIYSSILGERRVITTDFSFNAYRFRDRVVADSLERLGLIRRDYEVRVKPPEINWDSGEHVVEDALNAIAGVEADIGYRFLLTGYAVSFLEACRGPHPTAP